MGTRGSADVDDGRAQREWERGREDLKAWKKKIKRRAEKQRKAAAALRTKANHKRRNVDGPPCPRCGCLTEVRVHEKVTEKELRQPFYYSKWFYCGNRSCKTTLIMPPEFKVFRDAGKVVEEPSQPRGDFVMDILSEIGGRR